MLGFFIIQNFLSSSGKHKSVVNNNNNNNNNNNIDASYVLIHMNIVPAAGE